MAGGTLDHNTICGNVIGALHAALRGTRCRVVTSDKQQWVPLRMCFVYPDVAVLCGRASGHREGCVRPGLRRDPARSCAFEVVGERPAPGAAIEPANHRYPEAIRLITNELTQHPAHVVPRRVSPEPLTYRQVFEHGDPLWPALQARHPVEPQF
jgi:hypothetical protein